MKSMKNILTYLKYFQAYFTEKDNSFSFKNFNFFSQE